VSDDEAIRDLYRQVIDGWNAADAGRMTAPLADEGLVIGFDGSQMTSREAATAELGRIFADHRPAKYVTKVRSVRRLGAGAAVLHAVAGMVAPGSGALMPERNTVQTLVAHRTGDGWQVAVFQSTPARFDGRPELSRALTDELNEVRVART
jgi:uncharacterized protein (TIGR02246 family)